MDFFKLYKYKVKIFCDMGKFLLFEYKSKPSTMSLSRSFPNSSLKMREKSNCDEKNNLEYLFFFNYELNVLGISIIIISSMIIRK